MQKLSTIESAIPTLRNVQKNAVGNMYIMKDQTDFGQLKSPTPLASQTPSSFAKLPAQEQEPRNDAVTMKITIPIPCELQDSDSELPPTIAVENGAHPTQPPESKRSMKKRHSVPRSNPAPNNPVELLNLQTTSLENLSKFIADLIYPVMENEEAEQLSAANVESLYNLCSDYVRHSSPTHVFTRNSSTTLVGVVYRDTATSLAYFTMLRERMEAWLEQESDSDSDSGTGNMVFVGQIVLCSLWLAMYESMDSRIISEELCRTMVDAFKRWFGNLLVILKESNPNEASISVDPTIFRILSSILAGFRRLLGRFHLPETALWTLFNIAWRLFQTASLSTLQGSAAEVLLVLFLVSSPQVRELMLRALCEEVQSAQCTQACTVAVGSGVVVHHITLLLLNLTQCSVCDVVQVVAGESAAAAAAAAVELGNHGIALEVCTSLVNALFEKCVKSEAGDYRILLDVIAVDVVALIGTVTWGSAELWMHMLFNRARVQTMTKDVTASERCLAVDIMGKIINAIYNSTEKVAAESTTCVVLPLPALNKTDAPSNVCGVCGEEDENSYVQCDECMYWFHHACLGLSLNDSVLMESPWACKFCRTRVLMHARLEKSLVEVSRTEEALKLAEEKASLKLETEEKEKEKAQSRTAKGKRKAQKRSTPPVPEPAVSVTGDSEAELLAKVQGWDMDWEVLQVKLLCLQQLIVDNAGDADEVSWGARQYLLSLWTSELSLQGSVGEENSKRTARELALYQRAWQRDPSILPEIFQSGALEIPPAVVRRGFLRLVNQTRPLFQQREHLLYPILGLLSSDQLKVTARVVHTVAFLVKRHGYLARERTFQNVLWTSLKHASPSVRIEALRLIDVVMRETDAALVESWARVLLNCLKDSNVGVRRQSLVTLKSFLRKRPQAAVTVALCQAMISSWSGESENLVRSDMARICFGLLLGFPDMQTNTYPVQLEGDEFWQERMDDIVAIWNDWEKYDDVFSEMCDDVPKTKQELLRAALNRLSDEVTERILAKTSRETALPVEEEAYLYGLLRFMYTLSLHDPLLVVHQLSLLEPVLRLSMSPTGRRDAILSTVCSIFEQTISIAAKELSLDVLNLLQVDLRNLIFGFSLTIMTAAIGTYAMLVKAVPEYWSEFYSIFRRFMGFVATAQANGVEQSKLNFIARSLMGAAFVYKSYDMDLRLQKTDQKVSSADATPILDSIFNTACHLASHDPRMQPCALQSLGYLLSSRPHLLTRQPLQNALRGALQSSNEALQRNALNALIACLNEGQERVVFFQRGDKTPTPFFLLSESLLRRQNGIFEIEAESFVSDFLEVILSLLTPPAPPEIRKMSLRLIISIQEAGCVPPSQLCESLVCAVVDSDSQVASKSLQILEELNRKDSALVSSRFLHGVRLAFAKHGARMEDHALRNLASIFSIIEKRNQSFFLTYLIEKGLPESFSQPSDLSFSILLCRIIVSLSFRTMESVMLSIVKLGEKNTSWSMFCQQVFETSDHKSISQEDLRKSCAIATVSNARAYLCNTYGVSKEKLDSFVVSSAGISRSTFVSKRETQMPVFAGILPLYDSIVAEAVDEKWEEDQLTLHANEFLELLQMDDSSTGFRLLTASKAGRLKRKTTKTTTERPKPVTSRRSTRSKKSRLASDLPSTEDDETDGEYIP